MKRNAAKSAPLGGAFWDGGAETFINKGTNGRWRDVLSAAESRALRAHAPSSSSAPTARAGWPKAPAPRPSARRPEMRRRGDLPGWQAAMLAAARWTAPPPRRPGQVRPAPFRLPPSLAWEIVLAIGLFGGALSGGAGF